MTDLEDTQSRLTFRLRGRIDSAAFAPWMQRQARKLGVVFELRDVNAQEITVQAGGAPEMLEAFALACSLGPREVFVEALDMIDVPNRLTS